jgi:hypothetical protein
MSQHRYQPKGVYSDYARAGVGVLIVATPLVAFDANPWVAGILLGLTVLFVLFGARTLVRHRTRIELTDSRLVCEAAGRAEILWDKLDRIKLAYYATKRDRTGGWMQLTVWGNGKKVTVDSDLQEFPAIVAAAMRAAQAKSLSFDPATEANLSHLGLLPARGAGPG